VLYSASPKLSFLVALGFELRASVLLSNECSYFLSHSTSYSLSSCLPLYPIHFHAFPLLETALNLAFSVIGSLAFFLGDLSMNFK
jgi:hypothetical protein